MLRLPDSIDDEVGRLSGPDGPAADAEQLRTWGEKASSRADNYLLAHYFVGEAVTGIADCKFGPETRQIMIACTLSGAVVAFVPLSKTEEITFFQALEVAIRQCQEQHAALARAEEGDRPSPSADLSGSSLCFRNHLVYRSFYEPVKNTVDADLCESFLKSPQQFQQKVASIMGQALAEVRATCLGLRRLVL